MNRRGFLGSILALGVAPAIVRASSLMPVVWRPELVEPQVITAEEWRLHEFRAGWVTAGADFEQCLRELDIPSIVARVRERMGRQHEIFPGD